MYVIFVKIFAVCFSVKEEKVDISAHWKCVLSLLQETHLFCDEDCTLDPEEISEFHASHKSLDSQRAQLRQNLHQRFMRRVKLEKSVTFCNQKNIANNV